MEVRFAAKLTRSSKKRNTYVIYVPKSIAELLSPDKKYVVIIREAEGGGP